MQTAIVTGAGSGVGQATAILLSKQKYRVALIGRREAALRETAGQMEGDHLICPCDVGQPGAVAEVAQHILGSFNRVDLLVNAAGTNVPQRSLELLSIDDYTSMIDANQNGPFYLVRKFLPAMRAARAGTIINIVSVAGLQASPKSGAGYAMSKFALAGLTQSINAEERPNGIRACSIFPGDIDTPLLDRRPSPPPVEARRQMLTPHDVAACVAFVAGLPPRAVVEEMVLQPH